MDLLALVKTEAEPRNFLVAQMAPLYFDVLYSSEVLQNFQKTQILKEVDPKRGLHFSKRSVVHFDHVEL